MNQKTFVCLCVESVSGERERVCGVFVCVCVQSGRRVCVYRVSSERLENVWRVIFTFWQSLSLQARARYGASLLPREAPPQVAARLVQSAVEALTRPI